MAARGLVRKGALTDNPIVYQILGVCSALAVTNRFENALLMGVSLTFVVAGSSALVSALRHIIPKRTRMILEMLIIATFVIIVDLALKAYAWEAAKVMGAYVALIITNCIVMGRAEAFAIANPVRASFLDAVGNGLGYTWVLLAIALVREVLGTGKILFTTLAHAEVPVVPAALIRAIDGQFPLLLILPPGAFLVLGVLIWIVKALQGPGREV
ncbi:MAG: electron transport complex subunit RsxE [Candidatus Eisenbacteria bacterium]|jgi:Na+-transporting NADH:ubiquinone oxidoreductase subunit D|nr:electron transport complex subunit RsxE [Candidatus Eisenbacteria bacterium]